MGNNYQIAGTLFGYYLLAFVRILGIVLISPVFGRKNIPVILKIGLSLLLTYIIVLLYPPASNVAYPDNLLQLLVLCIRESMIGIMMGYLTVLFFSVVMFAGNIIDFQMGFCMAQVFDPQTGSQVPLMSSLLNVFFIICFFASNGHHMLIQIIFSTFKTIPPGTFVLNVSTVKIIGDVFTWTYQAGIRIAMPVLIMSMFLEIIIGIMSKSVPQMNFFVIGLPLRIFVGFITLLLTAPILIGAFGGVFDKMFETSDYVIKGMIK